MLTREHAIFDYRNGRVYPDRLKHREHAHYLTYAKRMLAVYERGVGRTRQELHREVQNIFGAELDCPSRRIDAFCKLLDDASTFQRDNKGRAAALRRTVFRQAATVHPLVRSADQLFEHEEQKAKARIAAQFGRTWDEIARELFADIIDFHRLESFQGYPTAAALLARYNVAQAQVALFGAISMTVWASQDFKTILRYAKLARLMHTIRRAGQGRYVFQFDGPASVLRNTRRYGTSMAKMLPALIACRDWRMHAVIQTPRAGWKVSFDLSSADRLTSHLPGPDEFDSDIEAAFAEKWGNDKREGWTMVREGEVLYANQKIFVPDFAFRHDDGRFVLLEIVGFWTPEYLQAKLETVRTFHKHRIVLAVAEESSAKAPQLAEHAIRFKRVLHIKDVMDRLNGDLRAGEARSN
jgi:predicted nuclease of restriction endonuclease-like RecB superfamily